MKKALALVPVTKPVFKLYRAMLERTPEVRVPRRAVVAHELERPETSVEELDRYYGPSYGENLYG